MKIRFGKSFKLRRNAKLAYAAWTEFRNLGKTLGFFGAARFTLRKTSGKPFRVRPRGATHPLELRPGTSDRPVFGQIFLEEEYACLNDLERVGLVLDCGGNIGCSAAWFLSRFPTCEVVSVEPDPDNFAQLTKNLAPYGTRSTAIRAGVWSRPVRLSMSDEPYRNGTAAARQVRICRPEEPSNLPGLDIGTLLAQSGHERISILKIDIEGAEVELFSQGDRAWLDVVDNLVIELHDDSAFGNATEAFFRAIEGQGFAVSRSGELTVCRRIAVRARQAVAA